VSYGGHLQLNVGPTATGRIPEVQADILRQMGRWLAVNGGGIWNTTGHPFGLESGCTGPSIAAATTRQNNSISLGSDGTASAGGAVRQCYTERSPADTQSSRRRANRTTTVFVTTTEWPQKLVFDPGMLAPGGPSPVVSLVGGVGTSSKRFEFAMLQDGTAVVTVPSLSPASIPAADLESSVFLFELAAARVLPGV